MAFAAMSSVLDTEALQLGAGQQPCEPGLEPATGAISTQALDVKLHPVFHIVEEPGGIRRLTEIEVPAALASKMHALCKNFCRAFRRSKIARTRIERTSKFADANRRSR